MIINKKQLVTLFHFFGQQNFLFHYIEIFSFVSKLFSKDINKLSTKINNHLFGILRLERFFYVISLFLIFFVLIHIEPSLIYHLDGFLILTRQQNRQNLEE